MSAIFSMGAGGHAQGWKSARLVSGMQVPEEQSFLKKKKSLSQVQQREEQLGVDAYNDILWGDDVGLYVFRCWADMLGTTYTL